MWEATVLPTEPQLVLKRFPIVHFSQIFVLAQDTSGKSYKALYDRILRL